MEIMLVWGRIKKLHIIIRENFTLNNYVKIVYGKNFLSAWVVNEIFYQQLMAINYLEVEIISFGH